MKTLNRMTITEKARLFHQLFKDQIPELIDCIEASCKALKEAPPEAVEWDSGLFGRKLSFTLVSEAQNKLRLYKRTMRNNSGIFADQLFSGNLGVFTVQCIRKCDFTDLTGERKINVAIDLFFNG
jgi:hypothetical protein